jgi:putative toxin-antitoxin system antitoxin component (TIGR02293 family)
MVVRKEVRQPPTDEAGRQLAAALLGGEAVLHRSLKGPLDVHEMILKGLPGRGLKALIEGLVSLDRTESLEKAVGISLRTFQRVKETPERPLSPEQSGRTWKFAEILAQASTVLGSREEAERWLERPAIGLNQQRPIDLLATPAGVRLVEEFLSRIEYGVYA